MADNIVWRQMSINHFYSMMVSNCLYFRALLAYSDEDERKIKFYLEHFETYGGRVSSKEIKEAIRRTVEDFEKRVYLACWYHAEQLTDIVFKEYAKSFTGVAVGMSIGSLIRALEQHGLDPFGTFSDPYILGEDASSVSCKQGSVYYDDVVYMPGKYRDVIKPYDILSPAFIKSQNHNDDREFRLCLVDEDNPASGGNSRYLNLGNASALVKKIAVRAGDTSMLYLARTICESVSPGSVNKLSFDAAVKESLLSSRAYPTRGMDGFNVFDLN